MEKKYEAVTHFNKYPELTNLERAKTAAQSIVDDPNADDDLKTQAELVLDKIEEAEKAKGKQISDQRQALCSTTIKKQKFKETYREITKLTSMVSVNAQGNKSNIEKYKMTPIVKGKQSPLGVLKKPTYFSIKHSLTKGELILRWKKVKGALAYCIYYTLTPKDYSSFKIYNTCTKTKLIIKKLESGKEYTFMVSAIGSAGNSPPSNQISKIVG